MESYYLITYRDNWADEMDIDGFSYMTSSEKEEYFSKFKEHFDQCGSYVFYLGTNEEIEYSDYKQFKNSFDIKKIEQDEYKTLEKFFSKSEGFFPYDEDIFDDA